MRHIFDQSFSYTDSRGVYKEGWVKIEEQFGEFFVSFKLGTAGHSGHAELGGLVHVKGGYAEMTLKEIGAANGAAADVLRQIMDFKKEALSGLWTPKFAPGEHVLVDKGNGAESVKILDVAEQAFEVVPKKALTVHQDVCRCDIKLLMREGCKCGAVARGGVKA